MDPFSYSPAAFNSFYGNESFYGSPGYINNRFYNNSSGTNWKDSTAFAYQQMAKYEDNALAIALMNYQNQYNSPYEQMRRYQQAGINPFDVVAKQSQPAASASPNPSGSARSSKTQEQLNRVRLANDLIQNLVGIVKGASSLQGDLQEIEYRKEAFPLQLSLLSSKSNHLNAYYQNLVDSQVLKNMTTAMNYINTAFMYGYGIEGSENSWENIPLVIPEGSENYLKPGKFNYADFYKSPQGQLIKSQIDLREAEKTNKKSSLEERKRQFDKNLDLMNQRFQEQKRHNYMLEQLAGAGLGTGFVGNLLRGLLKTK